MIFTNRFSLPPVPYSSMPIVQTLWAKVGGTVELDCSAVSHPSREIIILVQIQYSPPGYHLPQTRGAIKIKKVGFG